MPLGRRSARCGPRGRRGRRGARLERGRRGGGEEVGGWVGVGGRGGARGRGQGRLSRSPTPSTCEGARGFGNEEPRPPAPGAAVCRTVTDGWPRWRTAPIFGLASCSLRSRGVAVKRTSTTGFLAAAATSRMRDACAAVKLMLLASCSCVVHRKGGAPRLEPAPRLEGGAGQGGGRCWAGRRAPRAPKSGPSPPPARPRRQLWRPRRRRRRRRCRPRGRWARLAGKEGEGGSAGGTACATRLGGAGVAGRVCRGVAGCGRVARRASPSAACSNASQPRRRGSSSERRRAGAGRSS